MVTTTFRGKLEPQLSLHPAPPAMQDMLDPGLGLAYLQQPSADAHVLCRPCAVKLLQVHCGSSM